MRMTGSTQRDHLFGKEGCFPKGSNDAEGVLRKGSEKGGNLVGAAGPETCFPNPGGSPASDAA